jgi:hypothetical protein
MPISGSAQKPSSMESMLRRARKMLAILVIASVAGGLNGCAFLAVKPALKPIEANGWKTPGGYGGPGADYEDAELHVRVFGPTWAGTTMIGPMIPIVPIGADPPDRNIVIYVWAKAKAIDVDPRRIQLNRMTADGNRISEDEQLQFTLLPENAQYPKMTSPLKKGDRFLQVAGVEVNLSVDPASIDACTIRFTGFIDGGSHPIPDFLLKSGTFTGFSSAP